MSVRWPSQFRALQNPFYRIYFSGQLVSMSGTWMQGMIQSWLVYQLTHSGKWLGIIAFCSQVPAFFMSPIAGILADRQERIKTLFWVEVVCALQAFLLGALTLTNQIALWHLVVLSIFLGIASGFEFTIRHAVAIDMVGKEDLSSAISLNTICFNWSRFIGPALAGFLMLRFNEGWCFIINGISFIPVMFGLRKIWNMRQLPPRVSKNKTPIVTQFKEGLQYVHRRSRLRILLGLALVICFFGFPYTVLLPVFAKQILGGDAITLAWLTSFNGLGAFFGAILAGQFEDFERVEKRIYLEMLGIGISTILLGLSREFWLSLAASFLVGLTYVGVWPKLNTAVQVSVDEAFRGRVSSLYTMTFLGAMPIGCALAGWMADQWGAKAIEIGAGSILLLIGLVLHFKNDLIKYHDAIKSPS